MTAEQRRRVTRGVLDLEAAATWTGPEMKDVSEFFTFIRQRIGRTAKERLDWVVRAVQRRPEDLTPGDWDNLRSELAGFVHAKATRQFGYGVVEWEGKELVRPTEEEARAILARMRDMIEAAVKRQPVTIGRVRGVMGLSWAPSYHTEKGIEPRWLHMWREIAFDWADQAALALGELIEKEGTLLKECPAPLPRDEKTCGIWFTAKRPKQEYCSGTCQSRASTRAARAGTETPAAQRRKARKEG